MKLTHTVKQLAQLTFMIGVLLSLPMSASAANKAVATSETSQQLVQALQKLHSFKADYTQTLTDKSGKVLQSLDGYLVISKPNKVFWLSRDPFPQQVITNGKKIWVYDQDLDQVTVKPFTDDYASTPALLFSGDTDKLTKSFNVSALALKDTKNSEKGYSLTPKTQGGLFARLDIILNQQSYPSVLKLHDELGQVTQITLSQFKPNYAVKASLFDFVAPEGVDVLYDAR